MKTVDPTPGPWFCRWFQSGGCWTILQRGDKLGLIVADVYDTHQVGLIQAAPELLEAARLALREIEALRAETGDRPKGDNRQNSARAALRAAITRVTKTRKRSTFVARSA
jgi:hypothetical protein